MLTVDAIQLEQLIDHSLETDDPLMIWGPTGVGKTRIPKQLAAKRGYVYINFLMLLRDSVDFRGAPYPQDGMTTWLMPDDLPFIGSKKWDPDQKYIIHFDEINTAPQSVMNVGLQLVLERHAGPHHLLPSVRILASGNRQGEGAVQKMSVPLEARFRHALLLPEINAWARHANATGVDPLLIAFLRFRPELLHVISKNDPHHCSPRTWEEKVAKCLNLSAPFRQIAVASCVGEGPAADCEGFLQLYRLLPPIKEIIANPTTAKTPDEVSRDMKERLGLRFAIAVALARAATRANFENCLTYAGRLPREQAIVMVVDAVKRDPELMNTKAFVTWAKANQDVTL